MLRARNESGSRAGNPESEDPEKLFAQRQREERARELEEVAQLRATSIAHNLWVSILIFTPFLHWQKARMFCR